MIQRTAALGGGCMPAHGGCCFCFSHPQYTPYRPLSLFWAGSVDTTLPSGVFPVVWLQDSISHRLYQLSASSLGSVGPLFARSFGAIFLQRIYQELIGHNTLNPSRLLVSLGRLLWPFDSALNFGSVCFPNLTRVCENLPHLSEEWILCPSVSRIAI